MDSPVRGTRLITEMDTVNFDSGSFSESGTLTPAIPAGKKLLVQSVSVHALLTDGQGLMETRLTLPSIGGGRFWVPMVFQAAGSQQRHFTGNLELNTVLNSGESIGIFFFRNDNLGSASLNFARVTILG